MIGLTLAAMLLAGPPEAAAKQPEFDRACMDARGRDLCRSEIFDAMRARVGAPSAESLARDGMEGVRVFMVNGYGVDQPMVAILWTGGAAPVIEARIDRGEDRPSTITLPGNHWHRATTGTLIRLVRISPSRQAVEQGLNAKGELAICLHAWVAVVEAIEGGRVHRRVRNACGDEPIFDGAFQFATVALGVSEACSAVDADSYRNDWGRLAVCPAIVGPNVNGAAAIYQLSVGNILDDGLHPAGETTDSLAPGAIWRSPDETVTGQAEVATAWRRFGAGAEARLWVRTATGKGPAVEVDGIVVRESGKLLCRAASRQSWRQTSGRWRLESWTLGPCLPVEQATSEPDPN